VWGGLALLVSEGAGREDRGGEAGDRSSTDQVFLGNAWDLNINRITRSAGR